MPTRAVGVAVALLALAVAASCRRAEPPLLLATTTSVGNSGLLDRVLPAYRPAVVRPVLLGSGRALDALDAGDADVVISHAPEREARLLAARPALWYRKVLYNDFLIVGPADDPAGVAGAPDAVEAMRRIARSGATFLSRGDGSGTHERERALWTQAGAAPDPPRLVVAGAGMGQTLRVASRSGADTLADRGTFEALAASVALTVLHQGDPRLLNTYAMIADPGNARGLAFARWLAEGQGRAAVAAVLDSRTIRGFTLWPASTPGNHPEARPR